MILTRRITEWKCEKSMIKLKMESSCESLNKNQVDSAVNEFFSGVFRGQTEVLPSEVSGISGRSALRAGIKQRGWVLAVKWRTTEFWRVPRTNLSGGNDDQSQRTIGAADFGLEGLQTLNQRDSVRKSLTCRQNTLNKHLESIERWALKVCFLEWNYRNENIYLFL